MQTKLIDTTAADPLGRSYSHKLLEVASGGYAARRVALLGADSATIKLTWADPPYTAWSTPQTIVSDASLGTFDCAIDDDGNISLVYPEATTGYLLFRKLSFFEGNWTAGSKVTIYNGTPCYDPSFARESTGTLWVTYASFATPNRTLYAKSSADDGATWGSGATDPGNSFGVSVNAWAKILIGLNNVLVFATLDLGRIMMFTYPLGGGSWSSGSTVSTGSGLGDAFDAAVRSDGLIALVYASGTLKYREFDGILWSAETQISDAPLVLSPNVFFRNNDPVITFLSAFNGSQFKQMLTVRQASSFTSPVALDLRAKEFDTVLLYDSTTDSYEDRTSEASSQTSADLFHSQSGKLLGTTGDCVYLGNDTPFRYAQFVLSTLGSGGTVQTSYWNGSSWQAFTPVTGNPAFDSSNERILFWTDYASLPVDWQATTVNNVSRFWVKIEVQSAFATAPVGSMASAISEITSLVIRR